MLLFGHVGLTLGTALLLPGLFPGNVKAAEDNPAVSGPYSFEGSTTPDNSPVAKRYGIAALGKLIDIRLLLIGSLLPDIIDKPLGMFILRNAISNGRIFSHTLLFLLLIAIGGLYLYKRRKTTILLAISFGVFAHLVFDQMWLNPQTLFWPVYGFTFYRDEITGWIPNLLKGFMTSPQVYVPELVGAAVCVWFLITLLRKQKFCYFLKYGRI